MSPQRRLMITIYVTNTSWEFWEVRVLLNCKSYKQWEVWGTGGWSPGQLSKRGPMWSPSKDWGSWSVLGSLLGFIEGQGLELLQCTGSPDLCLKGDLRWKVNAESSAVAPWVPLATGIDLPETRYTDGSSGCSWTLGNALVSTKSG